MRTTALAILVAAILVCYIILYIIEKKRTGIHHIILTAVMTAMSIAGRFVFAVIPGFKPVTAIVVLAGIYIGADAGFLCGSLTALISNCYFGQGPWSPFQMLCWGMIGAIAGIMSKYLKKSSILLVIYGALAGVAYSFIMDIYTVLWSLGKWSFGFYLTALATALPFTIEYAVSNVLFLLLISKPVGAKLEHVMAKAASYSVDYKRKI